MLGAFGLRPVQCEYVILTKNGDISNVQLRAHFDLTVKGKGPLEVEQLESGENFCTCHEVVPSTASHMSFRRLTCHCHPIHTLNSYAYTWFQHVGEGRLIDSYYMPGKETQRQASFLSSKLRAPLARQVQP